MDTSGIYFDAESVALDFAFIESLTLTKSTKSGLPESFRLLHPHRKLVGNLLGWKRTDTGIQPYLEPLPESLSGVLLCPGCKAYVRLDDFGWLKCSGCGVKLQIGFGDGRRTYRRAYFSVARKNAKTQIAAALGLDLLLLDGEASPEIYIAAKNRDQSAICFDAASAMTRASDELSEAIKVVEYLKIIRNPLNDGVLRALSSDGKGKHGFNPSTVIIDEFHVWGSPEQELYDALTSGSRARRQPLVVIITTAGVDEQTLCGREYEYACRVRDGHVIDLTYLPLIYELPKDADWTDETLWHLANPTIGDIVRIEALREDCAKAKTIPSEQTAFRRLAQNQWVNSSDIWIPRTQWDACSWNGSSSIPVMEGSI